MISTLYNWILHAIFNWILCGIAYELRNFLVCWSSVLLLCWLLGNLDCSPFLFQKPSSCSSHRYLGWDIIYIQGDAKRAKPIRAGILGFVAMSLLVNLGRSRIMRTICSILWTKICIKGWCGIHQSLGSSLGFTRKRGNFLKKRIEIRERTSKKD